MPNLADYTDNINLPDPMRFADFVNFPDSFDTTLFYGLV
jgi:hypothetical protein